MTNIRINARKRVVLKLDRGGIIFLYSQKEEKEMNKINVKKGNRE